jgi:hypothetical protein
MSKNKVLMSFFLMIFLSAKTQVKQDSIFKKPNPIVFGDLSLGYGNGSLLGLMGGVSLNYQTKSNLFTFRHLEIFRFDNIDFFLLIPFNIESRSIREYSLLYGKRYIEDGTSYHFSGGFSYNTYQERRDNALIAHESFVGFPLEAGISWFKDKKQKYRVFYGLIPVGKPTSFGKSIGFKLHANIARRTYVGIGLTIGMGWHKVYENED